MDSWWQASREICQSDRCEQTEGGPRARPTGGRTESEGKRRKEGGREAEIDAEGEKKGGREGGEGRKKRDANVMRGRPFSCCTNDQANGAASKNTNLQIVNTQPPLFNKCNEVGPSLPSLRYHKHAESKYSVKSTAFCEHPIAS